MDEKFENINLDETGKETDNSRSNFKENVVEDMPKKEFCIRPIGNINKKVGKSVINTIRNKEAKHKKDMKRRRIKNRMANKSRKKNRKK